MENVYSIIEKHKEPKVSAGNDFDVEAWKAKKQKQREDLFALAEKTALSVNSNPATLDAYLKVMAQFYERTASNNLLIFAQRPSASRIGTKSYWKNERATIKRGEKGIAIFEQGNAYIREDGSRGNFYEVVHVFDESQTTARKLYPRRFQEANVVMALAKTAPVSIQAVDNLQGELAFYDPGRDTLYLQKGLSQTQVFWALSTELAHVEFARGQYDYKREDNLTQAELVVNLLSKRYNINATLGEPPLPASRDAQHKEISGILSNIQKTAQAIGKQASFELDRPRPHDRMQTR